MTDDEAKEMLRKLSQHYGQPVRPVKDYCKAMREWRNAVRARADRLKAELYPAMSNDDWRKTLESRMNAEMDLWRYKEETSRPHPPVGEWTKRASQVEDLKQYERMADKIDSVFLDIGKSSLLWRTLYCGEKVRTVPCPEHNGQWSGLEFGENVCKLGCGLTGWLPDAQEK